MYEGWERDAAKARENWQVVAEFTNGLGSSSGAEFDRGWTTRHVEAEADTGSRYVVVATRLGDGAMREGGPILLTVLWPWQDAWTMAESGYLDESYVAEHLTAGRAAAGRLHGGDLAALMMTIRYALGRVEYDPVLSAAEGRKDA